jgi:hypothetical protein
MADKKIATQPLYVGYALAHAPGDEVPAENVKRNGWEDGVANAGTKAAKDAQGVEDEILPQGPAPK